MYVITSSVKFQLTAPFPFPEIFQEKKKQLAGILTASQTIRLRPPSESGKTAPASSAGTLKLNNPAPSASVNLPPQPASPSHG